MPGTPTDWKRRYGGGIGNNYWDLLPFGSDDFYATTYFYSSLEALAEVETWIEKEGAAHQIAPAKQGENAAALLALAAEVKTTANKHFWNEKTGRFNGWIDRDGVPYDYGLTFVNLEAIHSGIATDEHARKIMDWVRLG